MQDGTTSLVISLAVVLIGAFVVTETLTSRSPWAMPATLMAARQWIRMRMAFVQFASLVLLFGKGGLISPRIRGAGVFPYRPRHLGLIPLTDDILGKRRDTTS
ncbi:hypothetical protein GB928_004620 [Shinella curvata]|uniref:Uncharacterized protein n=1 Tax=Shinella curvata TaxID=1817964 RepID=A0ABT8X9P4_9HYPH|nr:hypothetical protein [Shinella curvata]MCJ8055143.1 hypothetical protein [Shinella curvata]MDO6120461.1 hypothetical protein [Shinella curvata]